MKFLSMFLSAMILSCSFAQAESFKILGPRAIGMGGAYTAIAEDALAQYWNPAGLAQQKWFDVQMGGGANYAFTSDILKNANDLADLANKYSKIQQAQQGGGNLDADTLSAFMQGIQNMADLNKPGKGALVEANAGGNFRFGKMAFSVNNFTSVGADPTVDTRNISLGAGVGSVGAVFPAETGTLNPSFTDTAARDTLASILTALSPDLVTMGINIANATNAANALINQAQATSTNAQIIDAINQANAALPIVKPVLDNVAAGSSYNNNTSNLTLRGGSFTEIALGYGMQIPYLSSPNLYLGGNLTAIRGDIGFYRQNILQEDTGGSDIVKNFNKNVKTSWQPSLDLGVLYNLRYTWLRSKFGLTAKNINRPKFGQPQAAATAGETADAHLDTQLRAGAAFYPFNFWSLAADCDLTNNLTPVPGYKSRNLGLGTEINVFNRPWINIPLRAGLTKNISEKSPWTYTAGFGLNFLHFVVEVGGAISSETQNIKTDDSGKAQKVPANASLAAQISFNF